MSIKLGMIGGGIMGEAILSRLLAQKIYPPEGILVSEPQSQRREFLAQTYGVQVTADNALVLSASEVLLLAIKPQALDIVMVSLTQGQLLNRETVVVSILAGVSLSRLEAAFPEQPVIRAMPNTPATVGAGMTAIAPGKKVTAEHLALTTAIFQAVGEVVEVPETLMDGVTGLSGSGPAYVAIMMEALADGGVGVGLPRAIANQLALQTILGTAQLIQASGLHPAVLKDRVTSPGGTTIAGVAELEKAGFRSALIEAVKAASVRSKILGTQEKNESI